MSDYSIVGSVNISKYRSKGRYVKRGDNPKGGDYQELGICMKVV